MRRLKLLLLAACALLGVNGASAQASFNHTYTEGVTPAVGGDYFLYNIGIGQFLTSGLNYGTRATVDNSGRVLTLSANGTGYNIYTDFVSLNNRAENTRKAGYLTTNGYVDTGSSDAAWVFEPVSVDGYTNAYTIKNSDSQYLFFDRDNTDPGCPVNVGANTGNNYSYWLLIPKSKRENAGDYTHYIINTQMNAAWEFKTWGGSTVWNDNAIVTPGGLATNRCGEKWHAVKDIYQDIAQTLPNGKYCLHVQGFYRQDDGLTQDAPVLYINKETKNIGILTGTEDNMNQASESFTNGKYSDNFVEAVVTDGKLRVGINIVGANQWVIFDNFVLDYTDPFISVIATEIPTATAISMTADTWYKFIPVSSDNYTFTAKTIDDIVYTTTDQLKSEATGDKVSGTIALTEGTTYFIKSTTAQTLTISPQTFTYTVGEATADKNYIQEGNIVTVTYESLGTDNPSPTLVKNFSGVTFGGSPIAVTPTSNGFTFTVPTVTAATNYDLVIPAEAIGYSDGEGTYNAEQTITLHAPSVFNGTYYLYHPQTSRFLARGGSYGTTAVADFYGIPFTLTVDNEGYASMVFLDNNQGLFNGGGDDVWCWTDNAAGSYQFTIVEGGYNIKGKGTENNHYLYISTSDDYRVGFKGDATVWVLKTPAERNTIIDAYPTANKANVITAASLTSKTNAEEFATWLKDNRAAKDKTSSVGTAKITNAVGDWTWTVVRNQDGQPAYNNAAEAWCATGSWSQTITGLTKGIYKVTINAFERRANNATSWDLGEAGYGNVTSSYLKANDEQVRIKSWYEEVEKNGNNYNPNTMGEAVTAFNNDKYKSELYTYVGDDGNLTLTIAKPNYIWDCWLLWNNITLTYYDEEVSDEEATAIITEATTEMDKPMKPSLYQALASAKATFDDARNVPNYNALRTAIDNTATSIASYAAMNTNYLQPVASVLSSSNVIDLTTSAYTDYIAYKAKYENYTDANTEDIENATANGLTLYQGTGARYTSIGNILLTTGWEINGSGALTDGSGFYINTWSGENDGEAPAKDFARPFYEMWVSSGSIAAATLTRTIGGLIPDGVYKVTANVRIQYTEKVDGSITLQAGTGGIAVDVTAGEKIGTTNRYINSYEAIGRADGEGNLTINITVAENSGISWLSFRDLNYEAIDNSIIADASDYTNLNNAISAAEAMVIGFEAEEYAPYNNIDAITEQTTALAAAKAINQEVINYKSNVTDVITALTTANGNMTANETEVNAFYGGDFTKYETVNGEDFPYGWNLYNGESNHSRIMGGTQGSDNTGLSATSSGKALLLKYNGTYGETEGYTMPLKAGKIYKITFKHGRWAEANPRITNVIMTDPDGTSITLAPGFQAATDNCQDKEKGGVWYTYTGYFVSTKAGDYKFNFEKTLTNEGKNTQMQIAIGDIDLRTAENIPFADDAVPTYAPGTYPSVKITRELKKDRWATAIYPFAVTDVDNIAVLDSYNAATGTLGFSTAAASVANEPFLMKSASDKSEISLSNVEVSAADDTTPVVENEAKLIGTYSQITVTNAEKNNAEKNYVLFENKIRPASSEGATINPYRAYIQVDQPDQPGEEARMLTFFVDGETTGISATLNDNEQKDKVVFNLNGQRVQKAQKGIYIINGKKTVVK